MTTEFSFNKSQIYDFNGKQTELYNVNNAKTSEGIAFFRKMTVSNVEKQIASILKENPHPNIVSIYNIAFNYIDIELVNPVFNTTSEIKTNIRDILCDVKKHLQSLGIIYLDWKYDNIGVSRNGEFKLFDFDCSGIAALNQKEMLWIQAPFDGYAYRKCKEQEIISPYEMDNYAFQHFDLQFN